MNNRVLSLIKKNKTFLIATHVNPDPDAICSVLALGIFLRQKGKNVFMVFEDNLAKRFQFFPTAKMARKVKLRAKYNYDAAFILDCGDLDRIGSVEKVLDLKKPLINIDHHVTNTKFGSINQVKDASSTAEMLYDLLKAGKAKWDKSLALNIYIGIMTDTGSFRYENTTSKTHAIVSELLKYNIPVAELYRTMYERIPLKDLAAFTKVINGFQSHYDGEVVSVVLTSRVQKSFSENFDLRDAIFKYLRSIDGVEVIFIVSEEDRKSARVNFRSNKYVDVAKIAAHFDGGGHQRASGCQISKSTSDAKALVLKKIKRAL